MRFDTRDKKPKLWNVLIQAVFVAVVLLLMIRDGAHRHAVAISAVIALFLLAALIQLIAAFFRQIQYNPYSYNTIYYMGFALFLLAVWILQLRLLMLLIRQPGQNGKASCNSGRQWVRILKSMRISCPTGYRIQMSCASSSSVSS